MEYIGESGVYWYPKSLYDSYRNDKSIVFIKGRSMRSVDKASDVYRKVSEKIVKYHREFKMLEGVQRSVKKLAIILPVASILVGALA